VVLKLSLGGILRLMGSVGFEVLCANEYGETDDCPNANILMVLRRTPGLTTAYAWQTPPNNEAPSHRRIPSICFTQPEMLSVMRHWVFTSLLAEALTSSKGCGALAASFLRFPSSCLLLYLPLYSRYSVSIQYDESGRGYDGSASPLTVSQHHESLNRSWRVSVEKTGAVRRGKSPRKA